MLDALVANTVVQQQVYAGVSMTIRMVAGDAVDGTDSYGLSSLGQTFDSTGRGQNSGGMMSMLDIGGNYGRISIAAFKNFPTKLRIITVEPVPTTYFLLRWNLHLNGVPELALQEIYYNVSKPGVLPLNHGISAVDEKVSGFCYEPPRTMQSRMCNCAAGQPNCAQVVDKSVNTLVTMLGGQEITLLKMDCEGCEADVIPALMHLQSTTALRIHRFAGELHGMPNGHEDFACKADGAQYFVSMCYQQGVLQTLATKDRCLQGPSRESCEHGVARSVY
jgi:FkbM family methyltransferase